MAYEHLRLGREERLTDRHRRRNTQPRYAPPDPRAFGTTLGSRLVAALRRNVEADRGGFDVRRLLKIKLRDGERQLPSFDDLPGIQIVSHEEGSVVLAFASEEGLRIFEARLATLASNGDVTRKELLYVIEDFDRWTAKDRKGRALLDQGMPTATSFILDIEVWPLENVQQRRQLREALLSWLAQSDIEVLDRIDQPSLVMFRVRCTAAQADALLEHRDVRTVDLPPRFGIAVEMLTADVNQFPPVSAPAVDAAVVCVLDSGLNSAHPLLAVAVGDVQGFVEPDNDTADQQPHGHGTFVAGLALYGDVEQGIRSGQFIPSLRLLAGKVFSNDYADQTEFVERAVDEAVRYFVGNYRCRVFNLSYGDRNKIYDGRHVRGLAYTLDRLTRELGVVFVVPTGNILAVELPVDVRTKYPAYLFEPTSRILDPAPALSALTVGGVAQHTATQAAQRNQNTIEELPIALAGQPAPFTRAGPGLGGAIKPDLVETAGNWAVRRTGGLGQSKGLGVVSMNSGFALGRPFAEDVGTSYAAPQAAHLAALLSAQLPQASGNLLRAVLAAHARWPEASVQLLVPNGTAEQRKRLMQLVGYGQVDRLAVFRSLDDVVTLLAEDALGNDKHHFYELPIPDEYWRGGRRTRTVTAALAYSPEVRTTRIDYRRSKLSFTVVNSASLEAVTTSFQHNRKEGMPERSGRRLISNAERKAGTLQMSRWEFNTALANEQKLFVVVTRQDAAWPTPQEALEPYSLVVVLDDSANIHIDLYALVRAQLAARVQLRARVLA